MRLKKDKNTTTKSNNNIISSKQSGVHHNKNASMDVISAAKAKSIYLNKILQKNLGSQKMCIDQANLQQNYPNFQSSIQSILANEETRQKAKNYVIKLRNKQYTSPSYLNNNYIKNKNFSKTNYDFYEARQKKNLTDMLSENYRLNNNQKREFIFKQKAAFPEYNNYGQETPDKMIRVNKVNKYYDEIPQYSPGDSKAYFRSNLGMNRNNSRGVFNYNNNINNINNYNNNNTKLLRNANTNYPLTSNNRK